MYDLEGKRVCVAGHRGMVGSAVARRLGSEDCTILTATRPQVDLTRQAEVERFVADSKPDAIVPAVGGILANDIFPADFLYEDLLIESAIFGTGHQNNVDRMLFLGSGCIYPKLAPQPMEEDALLTAVAKIAGIKLARALRKQHGRDYISAVPASLHCPDDNFDLKSSHVMPAMIRKAHEAQVTHAETITVWGGIGTPRRKFLRADDCADALVYLLKHYSTAPHVEVGPGEDLSILERTRVVGYEGRIVLDLSKPDGTPRKLTSSDKLLAMGWSPLISLERDIGETYRWFREHEREL